MTNREARARERDAGDIRWHQGNPPKVGTSFRRWINQGDRYCEVFAVHDTCYAYEYEMPAGGMFVRIGNTATGCERSVGKYAMPKWVKDARVALAYLALYGRKCKAPLCTSQARSWGYCGRHAWRHFEPGEECAWCGTALMGKDHPITRCHNQRGEAFCSSFHRSSSGRALRQFLAAEGSER